LAVVSLSVVFRFACSDRVKASKSSCMSSESSFGASDPTCDSDIDPLTSVTKLLRTEGMAGSGASSLRYLTLISPQLQRLEDALRPLKLPLT
jgi:hypothetical protein